MDGEDNIVIPSEKRDPAQCAKRLCEIFHYVQNDKPKKLINSND